MASGKQKGTATKKTAPPKGGASKNQKKSTSRSNNKTKAQKFVARALKGIFLIIVGLFIFLCLILDSMGNLGVFIKTLLMGLLGSAAYIAPLLLIYFGLLLILRETHKGIRIKTVAAIILLIVLSALIHSFTPYAGIDMSFGAAANEYYQSGAVGLSGGVIGGFVSGAILVFAGQTGTAILTVIILIITLMIITDVTPISIYKFHKSRSQKRAIRDREDKEELKRREKKALETEQERDRLIFEASQNASAVESDMQAATVDVKLDDNFKFTPLSDDMIKAARMKEGESNNVGAKASISSKEFDEKVAEFSRRAAEAKKAQAMEQELAAREAQSAAEAAALATGAAAASSSSPASSNAPVAQDSPQGATVGTPSDPAAGAKSVSPAWAGGSSVLDQEKKEFPYVFPPITLLKKDTSTDNQDVSSELRTTAAKLVDTLESFKVSAKIVDVSRGPTVTRYELQPSAGIKVSKIVNLADDISLNLAASGVRIEAPIPGKAAIGIEVPNRVVSNVYLRDILSSPEFIKKKSRLTYALGKDVSGNVMVGDIAKMPHLLISGATGSGKSVCINAMIMSLIYKSSPDELRLLLVDPKVVELGVYNSLPHLLIPVVTDPKKAAGALRWAVNEMMSRYKLFSENNVRDLSSYNSAIASQGDENQKPLPQIVIIIDELSDLMMVAPNEVEDAICRLTQMARAAGMHLVVATQRPSVDVITGVIKANIPSRISFAVSSQVDSRTILDMGGAEKLLGKGDMLYLPIGSSKPVRIQGCFVSDKEIESVIDFIKSSHNRDIEYDQEILDDIERESIIGQKGRGSSNGTGGTSPENVDDADEMLGSAVEIVVEAQMASVSLLQRRLKLGYARAARIVDQMEERGIIGPYEGSKPRKVLITKQELMEKKMSEHNW